MKLEHNIKQNIATVNILGNLALDNIQQVKVYFMDLMEDSKLKGVVLNLEHVNIIDSNGITAIVSLFKTCKIEKIQFAICLLSNQVFDVIKMLDLDKIIKIFKTEQEAFEYCLKPIEI